MRKQVKWIIASFLIMILIFWFSHKAAVQSQAQSDFFLFLLFFLKEDTARFMIRKLAHFSIYTLLGICVFSSFSNPKRAFPGSFLICVLYACSDEFHQSFIPGRSCQTGDVLIDTCGACLGMFIAYNFLKKWG